MDLQEATIDDIPVLSVHHRKMFEEIWEQKGELIGQALAKELESAYSAKLGKQIPEGSCKAWIVQNDNQIIASGAITIVSFVPAPFDLNDNIAYLHSMYTEKVYRHKKCAQRIIERAYLAPIWMPQALVQASLLTCSGLVALPCPSKRRRKGPKRRN